MKRSAIAFLLVLMLTGSLLSLPASAQSPAPAVPQEKSVLSHDPKYMSNDELFAHYVEQVFYEKQTGQKPVCMGNTAYQTLDPGEKKLYQGLKPGITGLANGSMDCSQVTIGLQSYPWDPSTYEDHVLPVIWAMVWDMPYDFYWFDKVSGIDWSRSGSSCTVTLYAAADYSADGTTGTYYLDTSKTGAASRAASNAKQVVAKYQHLPDIQKLRAYKNYICDQTTYNQYAADHDFVDYGDPWQLIYVFDGDYSTNVVCEGYSKAFQYLCDCSSFRSQITCCHVTGDDHMWNVLNMDGRSFIVDVTNCDDDSIGSSIGPDGGIDHTLSRGDGLFMVNTSGMLLDTGKYCDSVQVSGSVDNGYRIEMVNGESYQFHYDQYTLDCFGPLGILDLSQSTQPMPRPEPLPDPQSPIGHHSSWAAEPLYDAWNNALIPERLYYQDLVQPIRRDEFAAVGVKLYEALSNKTARMPQYNPFYDTQDPDVLKAYALGIVNGTSWNTYSPNQLLTRQQAATMLTRAYKAAAEPSWSLDRDDQYELIYDMPPRFRDHQDIASWARDSVYFMTAYDIINGTGGGYFSPNHHATREQGIVISLRAFQNLIG